MPPSTREAISNLCLIVVDLIYLKFTLLLHLLVNILDLFCFFLELEDKMERIALPGCGAGVVGAVTILITSVGILSTT